MSDSIVVVCAADNDYAMPLSVTIRSALENLGSNRKILLFIIDGGISERNKLRISKSLNTEKCEIRWVSKPEASAVHNVLLRQNAQFTGSTKFSNITLYRLLIPDLIPEGFTKAIYLDCDLVITEDLDKLWDLDIAENYLLAACTKNIRVVSHPRGLVNWKELGFAEGDKYLSAGVLVLNLKKWRSNNMSSKALDYIEENHQYIRGMDNDVLVAIVRDEWGELDLRWNSTEARNMTQEEVDDAFILHYTSPEKPWVATERNPAKDLFFHYLKMTDWSGFRQTIPQRIWRRLKRETKSLLKVS